MLKLLFWLVVALIIGLFFAIRNANRARAKQLEREQTRELESVRCAQCGVFIPEEKAVRRDGQDFCSREHAEQWHREHH